MQGRLLLTTVMLFFFILSSAAWSADQPPIPVSSIHSIQADFIQEKHLKILTHPLVSKGTFTFQTPQSLRWEYQTPIPSILLMYGGKVKKFIARDGRLVEDGGMQLGAMQVVMTEISKWLDGRFSDSDMFVVTFPDKQTIVLTPRDQALAGMINRIELKVADVGGLLDSVTLFEGPDSYTKMIFKNRVLNKTIPVSLFTTK